MEWTINFLGRTINGGEEGDGGGVEREVVSTVVDSLALSIEELDEKYFIRNPPLPTIHQIPIHIRDGNEAAYTPKLVSIGPYHRDIHQDLYLNEETKGMKILYLKKFLNRNPYNKVELYASLIKSREEEARDCYHDRCNGLESKEFVQMMVLDGCFIIELFLRFAERKVNLSFKSKMKNWQDLRNDLFLMENQIPFFILKLILDNCQYQVEHVTWRFKLLDLCLFFLHQGKITIEMLETTHQEEDGKNVYHLLHLSYLCHMAVRFSEVTSSSETFKDRLVETMKWVFYLIGYGFLFLIKCFLLLFFYALIILLKLIKLANEIRWQKPNIHNRQKVKAKEEKPRMIPTATELNESGVIFKRKNDAKNSMDVSFENGIMEIPVVVIHDDSNSIFRNYLALEQNCPIVGNKFSSYVLFMDNLVDTTSDVAFLKKRKIIVSMLGCDEGVAKFFNGVMVGLYFNHDRHYLDDLFENVHVYWKKDHNEWRAKMIRNYFSSPWSIVSLFGAFTLLAFAATQVTFAVKKTSRM